MIAVLIFGALAMGMAFLAASVPGPVTQISTTFGNSVFSPLYGIFILGGISRFANWKGAVIGGIGSLCINMWLNIGALTMNWPLPTLPPTATNGCQPLTSAENETWMLSTTAAFNDGYFTPSYFYDDNNTTIASSLTVQKELVGIQKFYGLSYMWYSLFGVINTLIIGTIASLIFRDRDAESRVEDHLLIPFRQFFRCSSSGEDEPSASDIKSTVADAAADVESVASGEQEDATDSTVDEVAKL